MIRVAVRSQVWQRVSKLCQMLRNNVTPTALPHSMKHDGWVFEDFAPTNRMARAQKQRESAESSRIQMQQSVELDPTDTSASRALDAINLNSSMDFDEGVRALRRSLRNAFTADGTTLAIQDKVLESHNSSNRDADGRIDGVPVGIADVLHEDDWKLMPHAVMSSIKHVRVSFPLAVDSMGF